MRQQIEKLAATQALEAVKETLAHLQRWSIELEMENVQRPPFLTNDCRRARRLRETLETQVNSDPRHPEIDLEASDGDLLSSCCMFAIESLESSAIFDGDSGGGQEWIEQNMHNLFCVALEFATSPVQVIKGQS